MESKQKRILSTSQHTASNDFNSGHYRTEVAGQHVNQTSEEQQTKEPGVIQQKSRDAAKHNYNAAEEHTQQHNNNQQTTEQGTFMQKRNNNDNFRNQEDAPREHPNRFNKETQTLNLGNLETDHNKSQNTDNKRKAVKENTSTNRNDLETEVKEKEHVSEKIVKLESEVKNLQDENNAMQNQLTELTNAKIKADERIQRLINEKKAQQENADAFLAAKLEEEQMKKAEVRKTKKLMEQIKQLQDENADMKKRKADDERKLKLQHKQKEEQLSEEREHLIKDKCQLVQELSNLKSRLSKVVGDKVSENNPDIADLSDNNRPTRIAERYQELYDNQWTDAFETIVKYYTQKGETSPEQLAIEELRKILLKSFKICRDEFERQNKDILRLFVGNIENETDLSQILKMEIKLARRKCAPDAAKMIAKKTINLTKEKCREGNVILMVEDFVRECIAVCWLMVLQDPQVVLHTKSIEIFDGSLYKEYTIRGKKIHFIVWPALLLHEDGPTLSKGIAQCVKELNDNSSMNNAEDKHKQKSQSKDVSKPEANKGDKSPPDQNGGETDKESIVNSLPAEKKIIKSKQTNSASDREDKSSSAESSVPSIDQIRFKSKIPNTGGIADGNELHPE